MALVPNRLSIDAASNMDASSIEIAASGTAKVAPRYVTLPARPEPIRVALCGWVERTYRQDRRSFTVSADDATCDVCRYWLDARWQT